MDPANCLMPYSTVFQVQQFSVSAAHTDDSFLSDLFYIPALFSVSQREALTPLSTTAYYNATRSSSAVLSVLCWTCHLRIAKASVSDPFATFSFSLGEGHQFQLSSVILSTKIFILLESDRSSLSTKCIRSVGTDMINRARDRKFVDIRNI